ncbi:PoNe immunity protein domain-containing protein [Pseudomonas fluorescens]|uniref:PoNe immunity protein domain-containing protein n=1 Tax=Pseudomonas sp. A1230 TaxID=3235106 RepID=UPI0009B9A917
MSENSTRNGRQEFLTEARYFDFRDYSDETKEFWANNGTKAERPKLLKKYCRQWYRAFKQAPWHDSHLQGEEGTYVGYWAFEAGAVAFLYGIDDSKIDQMVYPKGLVEYARNHQPLNEYQIARIDEVNHAV